MRKPRNQDLAHLALGAAFVLIFATPSVAASDGPIKINQANAQSGNVTPGDAAGFPVTISRPGSYVLTSNLDLTPLTAARDTTAILITSDNVHLDLGGFSIIGKTGCSGSPLLCTPTGLGRGVASAKDGISIVNGTIRGMGNDGIALDDGARVENVHAAGNGDDGIQVETDALLKGNTVLLNADDGIDAGAGSTLTGNTAFGNGDDGIAAGAQCTVTGNTSNRNGGDGIMAGAGATVAGNTSSGQTAHAGLNLGVAAG